MREGAELRVGGIVVGGVVLVLLELLLLLLLKLIAGFGGAARLVLATGLVVVMIADLGVGIGAFVVRESVEANLRNVPVLLVPEADFT